MLWQIEVGGVQSVHLTSPIDNTRKLTETGSCEEEEEDGYEDSEEIPEEDIIRHKFSSLATGDRFTCGIELEGRNVQCWGEGRHSRGNGVPMYIHGPFKQISMHNMGLCGIYGPPQELMIPKSTA